MQRGFMTDSTYGSVQLPRWCPGEPETSWFTGGVKHAQQRAGLVVVAYRCPECAALRLYAPESPQSKD
jgi:hypothetical protein